MARATIEDVARRAGVTKSTVSHALSGKRPVSPETRRRIDEAIAALGYRPNPVAQRLAAGRSGAIGFVYPLDMHRAVAGGAALLAAASDAVSAAGFAFVLFSHERTDAEELQPFLESGMLDGVILGDVQMRDQRVRALSDAGGLFVMMGRTADNSGLNFVDIDVDAAVEECVEHLAALGHKRVAFLHEETRVSAHASRALQAYERACARRRLKIQAMTCPPAAPDARAIAASLLGREPEVSALIVSGELAAWGACQAAGDAGRSVPGDLSLVCLGKTLVSDLLAFGATGMDLRLADQARQAVALLLDLLGNAPAADRQVLLDPRWVPGETTTPAP
jgi:DNA-binding LacI/PurR family transcriptional regulator